MADTPVQRRLAAILAADVAGYSRMMGADEIGTLAALKAHRRELIDPKIAEHRGRIVKTTGDGLLVEFASVVDAVRCAVEVNEAMAKRNVDVPEEKRIEFRVGINVGDIIIDEGDILGDGVNIAARLEGIAQPGTICLSKAARDQVRDKVDVAFEDLGEQRLKNIARPIRVFRVVGQTTASSTASISGQSDRPALALPDKPSLAVLPFQNMSGDPEQEYFADGMVEEITTALSRVRSFFVIARNSSFTYKGKAVAVQQVGRDLGVRYVLEGSVRKAGRRVRISCQLIEAASNHHIWADRFEGALEDIFSLQDRVTESVVGAIVPNLQLAEIERAQQKPTNNLAAYDLYLRALPHIYAITKTNVSQSLELLHHAIEIEPSYSLAKATAARCYLIKRVLLCGDENERLEGVRLANEALTTHRDDPLTLAYGGSCLAFLGLEFGSARRAIERSLHLNPDGFVGLTAKGFIENWTNNCEAAVDPFQRALRLSPLDPERHWTLFGLANAYARLDRFEDGLEFALAAVREKPELTVVYPPLVRCLVRLKHIAEARDVVRDLRRIDPNFTIRGYLDTSVSQGEEWRQQYIADFLAAGLSE
jgi:adenylate cyclase